MSTMLAATIANAVASPAPTAQNDRLKMNMTAILDSLASTHWPFRPAQGRLRAVAEKQANS